jgi:GxxExxY protein
VPIDVDAKIVVVDDHEFHRLAYQGLRVVFDVHNQFGRLLDELLYKREIAARWEQSGFGTVARERQARIRISHGDFRRDHYLDLLLNNRLIIEAKVAENLAPPHRAQTLNYLFLSGCQHALLVNLRPERVQYEYVSTQLTDARRRHFVVDDGQWQRVNDESGWLREFTIDLIKDWGMFLEVNLYRDAVIHPLGGKERVLRSIAVYSGSRYLGEQRMLLLTPDTAIAFTAVTTNLAVLQDHFSRLLAHTTLNYLQWINFNHHRLEFRTLVR